MSIGQGKKIRAVREFLELGRAEFSQKTGIAKQTLISYEQEKSKPSGESLAAIANVWPEYAAYLLTEEIAVKQRNPELEVVARELINQKKAS